MTNRFADASGVEHVRDSLSQYIDNTLPESERHVVEEHLEQCAVCRKDLATLQLTVRALRSLPQKTAPRRFTVPEAAGKRATFFPWMRLTGGALAAVFVAILAVRFILPQATQPTTEQSSAAVAVETPVQPPTVPVVQPLVQVAPAHASSPPPTDTKPTANAPGIPPTPTRGAVGLTSAGAQGSSDEGIGETTRTLAVAAGAGAQTGYPLASAPAAGAAASPTQGGYPAPSPRPVNLASPTGYPSPAAQPAAAAPATAAPATTASAYPAPAVVPISPANPAATGYPAPGAPAVAPASVGKVPTETLPVRTAPPWYSPALAVLGGLAVVAVLVMAVLGRRRA